MRKMDEKRENDKELWKVFRYEGKELCAYTLNSTFPGEERETKEFLSLEHNVPIKEIKVTLEKR